MTVAATAKPKLLALISNYNHSQYVARAIEGVLAQNRMPDEFVIYDDGSTDGSVDIIQKYADKHSIINFRPQVKNIGIYEVFQDAIRRTSADYVYYGASDDKSAPTFFEKSMAMAEEYPDAGYICGKFNVVDQQETEYFEYGISSWKTPLYADPKAFTEGYLKVESPMHALGGSTVYRIDILKDLDVTRFQDLDHWYDAFLLRLIGLKHGMCYIPEVFASWTVRSDGMSQSSLKRLDNQMHIAEEVEKWMRSDEFKGIFPQNYVEQWSQSYRRQSKLYSQWYMQKLFAVAMQMMRVPIFNPIMRRLEQLFRRRVMNIYNIDHD